MYALINGNQLCLATLLGKCIKHDRYRFRGVGKAWLENTYNLCS